MRRNTQVVKSGANVRMRKKIKIRLRNYHSFISTLVCSNLSEYYFNMTDRLKPSLIDAGDMKDTVLATSFTDVFQVFEFTDSVANFAVQFRVR